MDQGAQDASLGQGAQDGLERVTRVLGDDLTEAAIEVLGRGRVHRGALGGHRGLEDDDGGAEADRDAGEGCAD